MSQSRWRPGSVPWGAPIPRPREPKIPVLKIFPGEPYKLRVLSPTGVVVAVHWDGDRSLPCTAEHGACWYDHNARFAQTRFQVWLHVLHLKRQAQCLLTLGKWVEEDAPELRDPRVNVRGAELLVWRGSKSTRSGLRMKLSLEPDLCYGWMPNAADLKGLLCKMWSAPLQKPSEELSPELAEVEPPPAAAELPANPLPEPPEAADRRSAGEILRDHLANQKRRQP